jgi:hypothetical protein
MCYSKVERTQQRPATILAAEPQAAGCPAVAGRLPARKSQPIGWRQTHGVHLFTKDAEVQKVTCQSGPPRRS